MRCFSFFIAYFKCILVLILLVQCYSFADKSYPGKIGCIKNRYVTSFPEVKKFHRNHEKEIPIEAFLLKREKRRLRLEIWTLDNPEDANRVFRKTSNFINFYYDKSPKLYFTYENFFILLDADYTGNQPFVRKELCKIFQTCFKNDTIDVEEANYEGEYEKGCAY